MARFYGAIGYIETVETAPGVWKERVTERNYRGNVIKDVQIFQPGVGTNDDIMIRNSISIVADAYAEQKYHTIRYVNWRGVRWKVTNIDFQHPRLILTLGGLYNGKV